MRQIWYAKKTKIITGLLLAVLAALAAVLVLGGMREYAQADEQAYRFEPDFAHSRVVEDLLREALWTVRNSSDADAQSADGRVRVDMEQLRHSLQGQMPRDVEYLFIIGEETETNCPTLSGEDFMQSDCNAWFDVRSASSGHASSVPQLDDMLLALTKSVQPPCAAYVRVNPVRAERLQFYWTRQSRMVRSRLWGLVLTAFLFLLGVCYLLRVCCRTRQAPSGFDRVWTEVRLVLFLGGCLTMLAAAAAIMELCFGDLFLADGFVLVIGGAAAFFGTLLLEALGLSLVRDFKNGSLLSHSILYRMGQRAWQWVKQALHLAGHMLAAKTGILFAVMLLGYTVLLSFAGILLLCGNELWMIVGLGAFAVAFFMLCARARDLEAVKKAVAAIKNGQTDYTVPEMKCEDYRQLADDVVDIGQGLFQSVSEKLRAERMKTELITNVSHDLKTPLTSIINYTKLLQESDLSPQEAVDYVNIIARKSERLKQLTSDLFDIAKVQSGSETIALEKLDAALLLQQGLAEYEEAFKEAGLLVQFSANPQVYILADGKKMSRVVENVLGNCVKYALSGTRVFISADVRKNKVVLEIKNTSAYPLDFDADEITERFVRGSKSRSEEGNGLGLAIAKSYTEACGGRFAVMTDGDLFKVQMEFAMI